MNEKKNKKVVIYARVSTEHEAQLSALENQKDWYGPILLHNPDWKLEEMYVDEGITGTSAKKRPQFMKMIEDANNRKFDMIITREVSRFARNIVDTLTYTRQLKAKGVEVFFITDNIRTFDPDGELRLAIMAMLAQDESRKTSVRVKSGQQTSMEKGVYYGNGNILGYDRNGREYVVNPEQAKTVRMIFDWYLDGMGIRSIQFNLESAGRLTAMGKAKWHMATIAKVLKNPFYCGILKYHKQWTPDYLEQKKINNIGDMPFTIVRGTHKALITEEEFNAVQAKIGSRHREQKNNPAEKRRVFGERQPSDVWTELLECQCGHRFNRKVWHRTETGAQYGYQCYSSIRSGTVRTRQNKGLSLDGICKVPMVPGWKLQFMAKHLFREYLKDTEKVMALAMSMLSKHIDDPKPADENTDIIEQKQDEQKKLLVRLKNLLEMRSDGEITRDEYLSKKEETEKRLAKLQEELAELQPEEEPEEDVGREAKLTILRYYMEQSVRPTDTEDLDENVIRAFVKKIIVHEDYFEWVLRFGPEDDPKCITVNGKRKQNASISSVCSSQHRQLLAKWGNKPVVIYEHTFTKEEAKAFLYTESTRHRIQGWKDFTMKVLI